MLGEQTKTGEDGVLTESLLLIKPLALPERPEKFDSSGEIKKMIKVFPREDSEGSEEEIMISKYYHTPNGIANTGYRHKPGHPE